MKFIRCAIVVFTLLANTKIRSQFQPSDYTYYIYYYENSYTLEQGAFFFLRKDSKTYFITASHVITGWDCFKGVQKKVPKAAFIRLFDNNNKPLLYRLDLTLVNNQIDRLNAHKKPDLFVAEIILPSGTRFNSIEKLISNAYATIKPDKAILAGFPIKQDLTIQEAINQKPTNTTVDIYGNFHAPIYYPDTKEFDLINYYIMGKAIGPGFSGAPVFLKVRNTIIFGGVCVGGDEYKNTMVGYTVRPEYIIHPIVLFPPLKPLPLK